jgi:hypothetical protein
MYPQYWGLLLDIIEKMARQKEFARELEKFARRETCWHKFIPIARGRFNPAKFIGKGWSIIMEETDTRSTALTELDLTKVQHVTMLQSGGSIKGEEKLKRLKSSDYIRLDVDIFLMLWENQHLIPESWKESINESTRFVYFDGTVLRRSDGDRCVLCLYWGDGRWRWDVVWLGYNWDSNNPSAVLAS